MSIDHTFEDTVHALYASQHTGKALDHAASQRTQTVQQMHTYINRMLAGMPDELSTQFTTFWKTSPVLHIAGTKGKGSTCAFMESILHHGAGRSTGLFTSPHLQSPTERFRINGTPVSNDLFVSVFWQVHDALHVAHLNAADETLPPLPGYFRLLTLVGLWLFARVGVDVVLLEVGCGGRHDATNVVGSQGIGRVIATGVVELDLDHTLVLGDTLEKIAYEKGGIFKDHVPAFSLQQSTVESMKVLQSCVDEVSSDSSDRLRVVSPLCDDVSLCGDLSAPFQRSNAAMACALCSVYLGLPLPSEDGKGMLRFDETVLSHTEFQTGLQSVSWPGRCQTLPAECGPTAVTDKQRSCVRWHIDAAHTPKSMDVCVDWYSTICSKRGVQTALIFNCSHEKDVIALFESLQRADFDHIVFTPATDARPSRVAIPTAEDLLSSLQISPTRDTEAIHTVFPRSAAEAAVNTSPLAWQTTLATVWLSLQRYRSPEKAPKIWVFPSLEYSLTQLTTILLDHEPCDADVLVTGSIYLIGGALAILAPGGDGRAPGQAPPSAVARKA